MADFSTISRSLNIDDAMDITKKLLGKQLKPGLNHLATNEEAGLELHVKAENGKLLEFVITNSNGCPVEETITIAQSTRSKTTCWKCGTDASGDTHCWQVPCPVIVGPWEPSKVFKEALVLA